MSAEKYTWFNEACMKKPGTTQDFKVEWNWLRYQIGGKMYAAVGCGDNREPVFITLKCEPDFGQFLREQYPAITAGYYMNKLHWNTVWFEKGDIPDHILQEMLDRSYRLIFHSLTKKAQAALAASND